MKHKWPHELEVYPIKCSNCAYSEDLGRFIGCTQQDVVLMKGSQLKYCGWYRKKGGAEANAKEAHSPTKSQDLAQGCQSAQKEPHTNAGRNPVVGDPQ